MANLHHPNRDDDSSDHHQRPANNDAMLLEMHLQALDCLSTGKEVAAFWLFQSCLELGRRLVEDEGFPAMKSPNGGENVPPLPQPRTCSLQQIALHNERHCDYDDFSMNSHLHHGLFTTGTTSNDSKTNNYSSNKNRYENDDDDQDLYRFVFATAPDELERIPNKETLYQMIAVVAYNAGLVHHLRALRWGRTKSSGLAQARSLYVLAFQVLEQSDDLRAENENSRPEQGKGGALNDGSLMTLRLALWNNLLHLSDYFFDYSCFTYCRTKMENALAEVIRPDDFSIHPTYAFFLKNWALNAYCSEVMTGLAPAA